jgi:hypothetical protein
MMTIRQIERLWTAGKFAQISRDLLVGRPEQSIRLESMLTQQSAAAAMALLRLDELSQSHHPFCQQLIQTLIKSQQPDGGWGEPVVTAIALRALRSNGGRGVAVDRGLTAIAQLQKAEGPWPTGPIRRMPEDAFASAFILFSLGSDDLFRETVRFDDAVNWFTANETRLDAETRRLWDRAAARCKIRSGQSKDQSRVAA